MSLSDYLLSTLSIYGLPVLFGVLFIGSAGLPMPSSLLLVAAGSFVGQGEMGLWPVLLLSASGAILGDNAGYALGRLGGRKLARRVSRYLGGEERFKAAETRLRRREGGGIFLSRWLLTPLGPVINIISGVTGYPWRRFLLYDVLGEALWVILYVLLGKIFSDRVHAVTEVLGNFTWMIVGLFVAVILGWIVFRSFRPPKIPLKG